MKELKYIVTKNNDFAIFSKLSAHTDVARSLYGKPVGAGFCKLFWEDDEIKIKCYGRSVSLELLSREKEDEEVIANNFYYRD